MTDSAKRCSIAPKLHIPLLLLLLLFAACRPSTVEKESTESTYQFMDIDTFHIPILATPEKQLAYARSTFAESAEKVAALKAIKLMYPNDRQTSGMAAMELAFLQLGDDYRFAGEHQCTLAVKNYLAILDEYSDLPEVAAKVLWYLGWISCDLLDDRKTGMAYYQRIVDRYPEERLTFLPPAPWLTILFEDGKEPQAQYPKSALLWADLARLEIIRNTTDDKRAYHSFSALLQGTSKDRFGGLALKILVTRHGFTPESEQLVKNYLSSPTADEVLKKDLYLAMSIHRRNQEAGKPGQ